MAFLWRAGGVGGRVFMQEGGLGTRGGEFENWTLYNAVGWLKIQSFCQFVSFFEVKCADRSTMWMRPNFVFYERGYFKLYFELLSV